MRVPSEKFPNLGAFSNSVGEISESPDTIVDLRINETLQIGAVGNSTY